VATDAERLQGALEAIDAANADDPNRIQLAGEWRPKELAHAERAGHWVARLAPDAGPALRLAARAHHVRRWAIPRADYPEGRSGYLRWRKALQRHHAAEVRRILGPTEIAPAIVDRVCELVQKRELGRDPEVQALEDALCLVFLETQLASLSGKLEGERLVDVLRKTLRKMSEPAIALARQLPLDAEAHRLLERALS
jgi:hypothetical protein